MKQFLGALGQHSPYLSSLPLYPWNHHAVVSCRFVAHPGDHSSFGTFLNRDSLRPSHCFTSDRRGVIGNGTGQLVGEIGMVCMKGQEGDDGSKEIFNLLSLSLLSAADIGFLLLCETLGGSFGLQFRPNSLNGRC
jgi:hypothetical protein